MPANRLPIVDRSALTRVVSAIEAEYGSQNKAARAIGISQGTFSRLQNAATDELDLGTFGRLLKWCGGTIDASGRPRGPSGFTVEVDPSGSSRRHPTEEGAIELAASARQGGSPWQTDEGEVERRMALYADLERSVLGETGSFVLRHYEIWLREERERLRRRVRDVPGLQELRALVREAKYRRVFESFANKVGRDSPYPGEEDIRYWIAVYRSIEPFVASGSSWGVERSWKELHKSGDLAGYLSLALSREAVLMDREPDLRRVSEVDPPATEDEYRAAWESE